MFPERFGQLYQRKGIATRELQDPLSKRAWQSRKPGVEELCRDTGAERLEVDLSHDRSVEPFREPGSRGGNEPDRLVLEAAGEKAEYVESHRVQPLHVVDDERHRLVRRQVIEQMKDGDADKKRLGTDFDRIERGSQGAAVRLGQCTEFVELGVQQLVQPREWHPHLGLDARGAQYEPIGGTGKPSRLVQKGRLAAARIATDQENACARLWGGSDSPDDR